MRWWTEGQGSRGVLVGDVAIAASVAFCSAAAAHDRPAISVPLNKPHLTTKMTGTPKMRAVYQRSCVWGCGMIARVYKFHADVLWMNELNSRLQLCAASPEAQNDISVSALRLSLSRH